MPTIIFLLTLKVFRKRKCASRSFLEYGSTTTKLYINTVIYVVTNIKVSAISDYGVEPVSLGESLYLIAQR